MKTYKAISTTAALPCTAIEYLTAEMNKLAAHGYTVATTVNVNEVDRGSAFIASVVMEKND